MAITNGPLLNSVPAPIQQALTSNYLDLNGSGGWAQQYVPDLMEKEAEVFGQRTISGFLAQVGAEEAMTADQVIWSEQGRLHLSYKGDIDATNVITIQSDIDGNFGSSATLVEAGMTTHGIRLNDTVIVSNANVTVKCLVTGTTATTANVLPYLVLMLQLNHMMALISILLQLTWLQLLWFTVLSMLRVLVTTKKVLLAQ